MKYKTHQLLDPYTHGHNRWNSTVDRFHTTYPLCKTQCRFPSRAQGTSRVVALKREQKHNIVWFSYQGISSCHTYGCSLMTIFHLSGSYFLIQHVLFRQPVRTDMTYRTGILLLVSILVIQRIYSKK